MIITVENYSRFLNKEVQMFSKSYILKGMRIVDTLLEDEEVFFTLKSLKTGELEEVHELVPIFSK